MKAKSFHINATFAIIDYALFTIKGMITDYSARLFLKNDDKGDYNIMRCIGIIGAMEVEVAKSQRTDENIQVTRKASMEFCPGIIEGKT